jgi:hypothetical protein
MSADRADDANAVVLGGAPNTGLLRRLMQASGEGPQVAPVDETFCVGGAGQGPRGDRASAMRSESASTAEMAVRAGYVGGQLR